ncbi:MAG: hypothetical protein ACKOXB_15100 [Flavobacteriales bacterium]
MKSLPTFSFMTLILCFFSCDKEPIVPASVILYESSSKTTPTSITLNWSKFGGTSFKEYRLYIGYSNNESDLSNETGTLVHATTSKSDTTYTITSQNYMDAGGTISPKGTYVFRVYVYDEHDQLSGSNIVKVVTPAWDSTQFTAHYKINLQTNFAGAMPIKGIDWDNNDNLWILYYNDEGYVNGKYEGHGKVVNYDYVADKYLDTIAIEDFEAAPSGIAFDDTKIWVQMKAFAGQLASFDITTGLKTKTMQLSSSSGYLSDIVKVSDGFLILWNFHDFEKINNAGGTVSKGKTPNNDYTMSVFDLGIAERNGEYWISSSNPDEITIMSATGNILGIVKTGLNYSELYGGNCRIAIRNNKLAIATSSQIYIYNITE